MYSNVLNILKPHASTVYKDSFLCALIVYWPHRCKILSTAPPSLINTYRLLKKALKAKTDL